MSYNLRAMKTDGYTEGRVRESKALSHNGRAMTQGLRRQMATQRVVLGKITPIGTDGYARSCYQENSQHAMDGLRPEGCEDRQQLQGLC